MNAGTQLTKAGAFRHLTTLEKVAVDFKSRYDFKASGGHHDPVVAYAKAAPNLKVAIRRAAAGVKPDGKMFSKGSCVRTSSRKELEESLLARTAKLRTARTFEDIYDQVEPLYGIGRMMRFNVAERIAAYLDIEPRLFLYLHAGPRAGWERLTGKREPRLRILRSELPPALRALSLHDVEDLLCEYRDHLHPGML